MNRDNPAGFKFCEIEEISINEWHPLPHGKGGPTQVHMIIQVKGINVPFIMRFKSPETLGIVVAALQEHSEAVWPKQGMTGDGGPKEFSEDRYQDSSRLDEDLDRE